MKRLYFFLAMMLLIQSSFAQVIVNETFENGNMDAQPPVGWICDENGWVCGYQEQDRGRAPHQGDWYVYSKYSSDVWMYKEIEVTAGDYYHLSFWHVTNGYDHFDFEVKAGANPSASAMTETVVPMMVINNEVYAQTTGVFCAPTTGSFYVGFHSIASISPWYLSIDDIVIERTDLYNFAVEALTPDTSVYFGEESYLRFLITNTGSETETVTLADGEQSNLQATYYIDGAVASQATLNSGASVEVMALAELSMNLNANELLHHIVKVSSTHNSHQESLDFNITALQPFNDFPLEEGFESSNGFPPFGWQNRAIEGRYAFDRITEGSTPDALPHEGSQYMARFYTYTNAAGNNAELVSPKMQLSATDNVVSFWIFRNSNHNINKADRFNVYYNSEPHAGGTLLGTVHRCTFLDPVVPDVDDWYEYSFSFDSPEGYGFIIIEGVSEYGWNLYLDDVYVNSTTEDHEAPTLVSLQGNREYADTEMHLSLRVHDASGVPATMNATYTINGVDYDLVFSLNAKDRANYDYVASIPAQPNYTYGTMTVHLVDELGNAAESESLNLEWAYQRPFLFEDFDKVESLSIPDDWSQTGNETMWQWYCLGTTYYTDYDENEFIVEPHSGPKQAILEWDDYNNDPQDQKLISPIVEVTRPTSLEFWTWVQYGSPYYDQFAVEILDCSTGIWTSKWNATDLPYGQINAYDEPINICLDEYIGKNVRVGFHGYNSLGEFLGWNWFVDDVKVVATDTTGVSVNEFGSAFAEVYPNPSKGLVTITSSSRIQQVTVMDMDGRALEAIKADDAAVELDMTGYPRGLYLLQILTDEGCSVKKISLN